MSVQQMREYTGEQDSVHLQEMKRVVRRSETSNMLGTGLLWIIAAIVIILFVGIIVYLLIKGGANLFDPNFYGTGPFGVGPEIFNTFYILIFAEIVSLPIALAAAIYLIEYAKQGLLVSIIHFAAETLASFPSIVLGLFGVLIFSIAFHMGTSRIAGALTLLCLNLPLALRLFEGALASVPQEIREGGLALGTTKWRTIRTLVLPSALPGIITAIILTAGKIIGEAAALIFTMGLTNPGSGNVFTLNPFIASDTLTTHLYYVAGPGAGTIGQGLNLSSALSRAHETSVTAGSAALLMLLLLIINISARIIGRLIQKRLTAA